MGEYEPGQKSYSQHTTSELRSRRSRRWKLLWLDPGGVGAWGTGENIWYSTGIACEHSRMLAWTSLLSWRQSLVRDSRLSESGTR